MRYQQCDVIQAICFDWGGTLMSENGPEDIAMAFWPEVSVIAGAKETLSELCRNYPLYIATNASVSTKPLIERALERGGLREHIREIFCFTEIGFRKSQLEFWRVVESTLRIPLNQIAMIGDSLEQDVLAPRQFGLFTVWFNEYGRQPNPKVAVPMVTHLMQIHPLIMSMPMDYSKSLQETIDE